MGIVVQAPPPPHADSAPGTTLPSCPAAPGGEEAGQAGRLLRLGEAQRFRSSRQVSARPRGLGLLRPRLPRRASGSWGGGRGCGGRRPRGELGSKLGRARAGEGSGACACARARARGAAGPRDPALRAIALLRVRAPLPSVVETLCPSCFRRALPRGHRGQPSTSGLSTGLST